MGNDTAETLAGLMAFHLTAAIGIAESLIEPAMKDEELYIYIHEVINEAIREGRGQNDHALWETMRDYFDPGACPMALEMHNKYAGPDQQIETKASINYRSGQMKGRSLDGGDVIELVKKSRKDH